MSETIKFRIDIEGNGEKILKQLNIRVDDFNAFDKSMRAVNTMAGENKI